MKKTEIGKALTHLTELFPGALTQTQTELLSRELEAVEYMHAVTGMNRHRLSHEFLSIPNLIEGIRAVVRSSTSGSAMGKEGSWFDVKRKQSPALSRAGDAEVAIRVGWQNWMRCEKTPQWRVKITREAMQLLEMAGVPADECEAWANVIFEDVSTVKLAIDNLRGALPGSAGDEHQQLIDAL
jgi:hypothetical protein